MEICVRGSGHPVVFLHGCPTTTDVFDAMAAQVASFAKTAVVSLPRYGASPALDRPWTLPTLQGAIEDTLLAKGIDGVSVVGFSGGAYLALALAARARLRVRSVVSLAGMLAVAPEERDGYRQFAAGLDGGADLRPVMATRFLSERARTREQVAAVEAWLDATPAANLAIELRAFADAEDLTEGIRRLDIPILARVGAEDVATPVAKSEAIARAAKRGTLQIVAGAGHALPIEDAEATSAAVVEALRQVS